MKKIFVVGAFTGMLLVGCGNGEQAQATKVKEATPVAVSEDIASEAETTDYTAQIEALQAKVTEGITKAEALQGIDRKTGIQMLTELEAISNEVELLEDEIEWEAKNGKMLAYRAYLKQLSQMDKQLDVAENQVEKQFGIDD